MSEVWCQCGNIITFAGETRCENCFADDAQRFSGRDMSVDLTKPSAREASAVYRRSKQIKSLLGGDANGNSAQPTTDPRR